MTGERIRDKIAASKAKGMWMGGHPPLGYRVELLRLALLSPAVVRGILDGQQPKTLSLIWLKNHLPPSDWDEQHQLFNGFDA